jgi:hypothetical protein
MGVSGELHTWPFYLLGKGTRYPFYRRLGKPQSWSGYSGEEEIFPSLSLTGTEP